MALDLRKKAMTTQDGKEATRSVSWGGDAALAVGD